MLLSALVMPGAGHIYLKHPWRGMLWIIASLICLWVIGHYVWQQTAGMLTQLQSTDASIDPEQIRRLTAQTPDNPASNYATLVLVGCWIGSLIDTYRLSKKSNEHT